MELLDSVAPDDIPEQALSARSKGLGGWRALYQRVVDDSHNGLVTVVKLKDQDEYKKLRNGTSNYFREGKYTLDARLMKESDGLRVYLQAIPEPETIQITRSRPPAPAPAAAEPPVRRISVGNRSNSTRH